jgi:tetratricopeptide (TPR) repeat protein
LGFIYDELGDYALARPRLERAIVAARELGDPALLSATLSALGRVLWRLGSLSDSRTVLTEAIDLARQTGDKTATAEALRQLGNVANFAGEFEMSKTYNQESLALAREIGDLYKVGAALNNLGILAMNKSDLTGARAYFEEGLAVALEERNPSGEALILGNLAETYSLDRDYHKAIHLAEEVVALAQKLGSTDLESNSRVTMGYAEWKLGGIARAKAEFEIALRIGRESGAAQPIVFGLRGLAAVALAEGRVADARAQLVESLTKGQGVGEMPLLHAVSLMVHLLLAEGQPEQAAELLGLVVAHPAVYVLDKADAEEMLEPLRDRLGADALDAALKRGKDLDLDQMVEQLINDTGA